MVIQTMRVRLCLSTMLLVGCMDRIPHEDPTDVAKRGACTMLENVSFSSIEQQPDRGAGPTGPVACHWSIVFSPNDASSSKFSWIHSDVGVSGLVTCDETGTVRSDEASLYQGHIDDATLDLSGTTSRTPRASARLRENRCRSWWALHRGCDI